MWPQSDKTEELLGDAKAGRDGAVDRLLDRHREAVRRMVEMRMDRRLMRRVDASDIVQEVLIEAHRQLALTDESVRLEELLSVANCWGVLRSMARS